MVGVRSTSTTTLRTDSRSRHFPPSNQVVHRVTRPFFIQMQCPIFRRINAKLPPQPTDKGDFLLIVHLIRKWTTAGGCTPGPLLFFTRSARKETTKTNFKKKNLIYPRKCRRKGSTRNAKRFRTTSNPLCKTFWKSLCLQQIAVDKSVNTFYFDSSWLLTES